MYLYYKYDVFILYILYHFMFTNYSQVKIIGSSCETCYLFLKSIDLYIILYVTLVYCCNISWNNHILVKFFRHYSFHFYLKKKQFTE